MYSTQPNYFGFNMESKMSMEKSKIFKILGITGGKVYKNTNLRFNTLLDVCSNEFNKEGCYFNLYSDKLNTLISLTDIDTISSCIKKEENSTIYSSIGKSSLSGKSRNDIKRTIRWGILVSQNCELQPPEYYIRCNTQKDLPSKNLRRKSQGGFARIHYGHLLSKCILQKIGIEGKFVDFPNMNNIYAQTERANVNSAKNCGQKYFEDRVIKEIDSLTEEQYFYYEVEAIFCSQKDRVPIGNRLRGIKIDTNTKELEEMFFVFIPNFQEGYKIDYRNGF